jgi:hypothetical protein
VIRSDGGIAYVAGGSGLVPVDLCDPAGALMAEEERVAGEAWVVAGEAWADWVRWIFEAGQHPVDVARRLVGATAALAPHLVRDLPARERAALAAWVPVDRAVTVLAGGKARAVRGALARMWRRERAVAGAAPVRVRSLAEMLAAERALGGEELQRQRVLGQWLGRVWRGGPCVREALKILFVDVRAVAADVAGNMSGEEVAAFFGQGRGAESARVKRVFSEELRRAGCRAVHARFQKSAAACARYALAQRGNGNRRSA